MPLSRGERLGPYEIISPLGKGGMGEVWRARDSRVGRDVAVKISEQRFSELFEREARAIAALNHPNICTLFDVGPNYLVMELVDGSTLAEWIAQGPVLLKQAISIAKQIADALEAAHCEAIVHRDLKPANIKIRPDGAVKVLDFGLAQAVVIRESVRREWRTPATPGDLRRPPSGIIVRITECRTIRVHVRRNFPLVIV
jgi:serine/threonine protein kinase